MSSADDASKLSRGALATFYAAAMIVTGGLKFLLLSALLYAPGTALHVIARREPGAKLFSAAEGALFAALGVAAITALYALVSGALAI